MKNYSKITPEGTKDYLAMESRAIRCAEKRLSSVFKSKGYEKVILYNYYIIYLVQKLLQRLCPHIWLEKN